MSSRHGQRPDRTASGGSLGLSRDHALDQTEPRTLTALNDEAFGGGRLERLAQEVIGLQSQPERLEQALERSNRAQRAAHVLEQQQPAAGSQYPVRLGHRLEVVWDRAERQRGHHGVEALSAS